MTNDKKELIKYSYNQLARKNLPCRFIFEDWKHLERLANRLKPNSKILDVGCGNGIPIDKFLIDKGFDVTGIDISEEQITLAKKNFPKGKFFVMDMENITLPENSFDAIIAFYSIFHVERSRHYKLLEKFNKLLRGGGYIMITFGAFEYEKTEEEYEDIKLFWNSWSKSKNLEILRNTRFQLIYEDIHKSGGDEHLIIFAKKPKKESK